jgi:hypothetical protein
MIAERLISAKTALAQFVFVRACSGVGDYTRGLPK